MTGTVVTSIGLNPSRVLRIASALRPDHALLLTSTNTEHLVQPLHEAADQISLATTFEAVPADPYRVQVTLDRLRAVVGSSAAGRSALSVVLAGGTKPMLSAQAVLATRWPARRCGLWTSPPGCFGGSTGECSRCPSWRPTSHRRPWLGSTRGCRLRRQGCP